MNEYKNKRIINNKSIFIIIQKQTKKEKMASQDDFENTVAVPDSGNVSKNTQKKSGGAWKRQVNNKIMETLCAAPAPEPGAGRAASTETSPQELPSIVSSTIRFGEGTKKMKKEGYTYVSFDTECEFMTQTDSSGRYNVQYCDHISSIQRIFTKKSNGVELTRQDEIKFQVYEKNLKTLKRFLSFKYFKYNRIHEHTFTSLFKHYFENNRYVWNERDGITDDLINHLLLSKNHKFYNIKYIYLNFLLTFLIIHHQKLYKDTNIRERVGDFFFLVAVLQFSLEIQPNVLPSSQNIMIISKALSQLSNKNLFYTVENVNTEIEHLGESLRLVLTQNLEFYSNKCPARNEETSSEKKKETETETETEVKSSE